MRFAKAHGLGNDFILVAREECPQDGAGWARRLCERHEGIGGDGVILYAVESEAASMRLLNADGSDGDISGNGLRCLAAYLAFRKGLPERHVIATPPGPRQVQVRHRQGSRFTVLSDLGVPRLSSDEIPMALDPPLARVIDRPLDVLGRSILVTVTSLGNPHCAVFGEEVPADEWIGTLGPALENHPSFPRRTNVEFVTVVDRGTLRVRFWERGVGITRASGTGAASAAVAAMLKDLTDRRVQVVCDGGTLAVEWPEGGAVRQEGEVELLFEGEWLPVSAARRSGEAAP
jgi:diaminopimelate epimerase